MTIESTTSKTFKKKTDRQKEKQIERHKPKKTIEDRQRILNKLVNLDPTDETSFQDILKPDEAKAVEKIDDKSILWAQIMRVILTYTKSNDLSMFINAVEILEVSLGSKISRDYKNELRTISILKRKRLNNEIRTPDGDYENRFSVMNIEKNYWLDKYRAIINELMRQGLWLQKGH